MPFSVGMDLVDVSDVTDSLARHGDRWLERVFTEREVAAYGGDARLLAGCFAAKEATLKALGAEDEPVDWRAVEVVVEAGAGAATLHGAAAELAAGGGLEQFHVSVTGGHTYAAAVVLAVGDGTSNGEA
jgi:holo-[acyl-carrier protein] synthase